MSSRAHRLIVTLLLLPAALAAQAPRIAPSTEPAWYQGVETITFSWVRGVDTARTSGTEPRVAKLTWSRGKKANALIVNTYALDVHRSLFTDTLRLDAHGAPVAIPSNPTAAKDGYALFLRLPIPPGGVDSGATWGDSTAPGWPTPGVRSLSARVISYRSTGQTDTLGAKVTVIEIEGVARYRESTWIDSAAGRSYRVDATGPFIETWWLDPARGELLARRRILDLDGVGITSADSGLDTLPVSVHADDAWGRISPERAAVLTRTLPAGDTSYTYTSGPVVLHTTHRTGEVLESSLTRNDGLVGTALAVTDHGLPSQFQALWTTPGDADVSALVSLHGDSVDLGGTRTGSWHRPTGPWAVADEGMEEQLIPILRTLTDTQPTKLPVLRPYFARWDTLRVVAKTLDGGARVFVTSSGGPSTRVAIVADSNGDLLTVERATDPPSRRLPPAGTPQRARVDQIFHALGVEN